LRLGWNLALPKIRPPKHAPSQKFAIEGIRQPVQYFRPINAAARDGSDQKADQLQQENQHASDHFGGHAG
jgi:hypothetical protein